MIPDLVYAKVPINSSTSVAQHINEYLRQCHSNSVFKKREMCQKMNSKICVTY